MGLLSKLFGSSEEPESTPVEMPSQIIGPGDGSGLVLVFGDGEYKRPASYTAEEAERVAAEWKQREGVADARPVTFAGVTHVHIDYYAEDGRLGDIGAVNPDGEQRIEMGRPEERPWWKFW
jgi:hypothetical protein